MGVQKTLSRLYFGITVLSWLLEQEPTDAHTGTHTVVGVCASGTRRKEWRVQAG